MTNFSTVSGARIAYDVQGSGPPLVLIHGAEGSRRSFDKVAPGLSKTFTVITYDQRDCGETENSEQPASLETLSDDVKQLLESLGYAKAIVYGTSFGGRVAQTFALRHPEMVDRLILASTWPLPLSLGVLNGEIALKTVELRNLLPESAERLVEYFYPPAFLEKNPEYKSHFRNAKPRSERSARRSRTVTGSSSLDAADISAKTFLMAGQLDRLVPPELTIGMSSKIADSESVVLEGVGHISYVQSPEEVIRHITRFCG